MPELPMAAAGADQAPTIIIKDSEKLADLQATDDTAPVVAGAGPDRSATPTPELDACRPTDQRPAAVARTRIVTHWRYCEWRATVGCNALLGGDS
jgi:hypothetical protein